MDRPKYKRGDIVMFPALKYERRVPRPDPKIVFGDDLEAAKEALERYDDERYRVKRRIEVIPGVVLIVDVDGAIGIDEHSYDIVDPFEPCLHKHVPQSSVVGLVEDEDTVNACREAYGLFEERTRAMREKLPPLSFGGAER